MPEQRLFHVPNLNVGQLSQSLSDWYRSQRFEVQMLEAPGGGIVIQARQEEAWRSVLGMSATLNILLRHQQDGNLVVEIGQGKWVDKAAAAGVGMFILWPMLLTAGYGAWQQSKLPQRTFEFIQNFIATGGSVSVDMAMTQAAQLDHARRVVGMAPMEPAPGMAPTVPPVQAPPVFQETQTAPVAEGAAVPPRFCSGCGTKLAEGVRFCSNCGAKVG